MKSKKKLTVILSVTVIIILLLIPKINFEGGGDDTSKNESKTIAVNVTGKVITPSPLKNKIFTNGTIIGNEEVELHSETSGKVTVILFEEGKRVKKDELLLKTNDAELQAIKKKNKLREELAKEKENRMRLMLEKNLSSQLEYDILLNELNTIRADIEYTQAQINKTEIHAPFDGVIGLRSVSVGSYISPSTKVATLQSLNPVKINFAVPQKYFGEIKNGKQILLRLPNTDKIYTGKIYAVEPKIDQNTRSVQARAIVNNDRNELSPGAYVEVNIILNEIDNALLIPSETIVPDIKGEKVFLYKNGIAAPQIVTTGIRTEKDVQIITGLKEGDTLITSGIIQLRPNTPVKLNSIN
ncbi:MAG: efflux RND transporter periplasmic adaptor subunit [Bacteroidetes bacterium]|nr:efflux RND transporter periplasmic adaptor subunit [Bacteroidota bacterium]